MNFIRGMCETDTGYVLINGYEAGRIYTHTYIHFSNNRFISILFQFSPPTPIPIGTDFAGFRQVRIFLPAVIVGAFNLCVCHVAKN